MTKEEAILKYLKFKGIVPVDMLTTRSGNIIMHVYKPESFAPFFNVERAFACKIILCESLDHFKNIVTAYGYTQIKRWFHKGRLMMPRFQYVKYAART